MGVPADAPLSSLCITIDTFLPAGTYYLRVNGAGNTNVSAYGRLGLYTLSGTAGALPIHNVSLKGEVDKNKHRLSWSIIADEPIKAIEIQKSTDSYIRLGRRYVRD